jgi:NAD(P)-dependent dehydrogenase (short-subunit alcohol dehydrogenase family)
VAQTPAEAFSLAGRVAVVTGAGGGLGNGICGSLAAAGATVIAAGRTRASIDGVTERVRSDGGKAHPILCDVTSRESIDQMMAEVNRDHGGIDILVNNAAIYPRRAWTQITGQEWDEVLGTNLKGYFMCAQSAFGYMKERGNGRIINVASITLFGGWPMLLDYVTSKGGIMAFTRALAREIGPDGVTVNTISPGAFPTDAEKIHPDPEGYNQYVLDNQSIKRRGTPDDIGNLVVFLSSDASSFITGQMIQIDGGWVMH